jgi:hypothetical protein
MRAMEASSSSWVLASILHHWRPVFLLLEKERMIPIIFYLP